MTLIFYLFKSNNNLFFVTIFFRRDSGIIFKNIAKISLASETALYCDFGERGVVQPKQLFGKNYSLFQKIFGRCYALDRLENAVKKSRA